MNNIGPVPTAPQGGKVKRSSVAVKGRPHSIEVIEEGGERFLEATYADGSIVRKRVDPNERPKRNRASPLPEQGRNCWTRPEESRFDPANRQSLYKGT